MLFFLLALAAHESLIGTPVSGNGYEGIVVACTPASPTGCWEPTEKEIARLELVLASREHASSPQGLKGLLYPLRDYRRQYLGATEDGRKIVAVFAFHRLQRMVISGDWQRHVMWTRGGSGFYFSGHYSVENGRFIALSINDLK